MEELTKIAEIIQGLGAEGKQAFVWWLVFSLGKHLLTWGAVILIVWRLSLMGLTAINNTGFAAEAAHEINTILPLTHRERLRLLIAIRKGLSSDD